jgi:hypothetical protein
MLVTEEIEIDGRMFKHNYSNDKHYIIREDGVEFADAIDVINTKHVYTESSRVIEEPENNEEAPVAE